MFPVDTIDDESNGAFVNVEHFSNRLVCRRFSEPKNFHRFYFGEFCLWAFFTMSVSLLLAGVSIVVSKRSKKQMFRVYASWVVATMKYVQTVWDWSAVKPVGITVGTFVRAHRRAENPVARIILTGRPIPAAIRLYNLSPKSLLFRWCVLAFSRTKLSVASLYLSGTFSEWLTAALTSAVGWERTSFRHIGLMISSFCLGLTAATTAVGLILPKFLNKSSISGVIGWFNAVGATDVEQSSLLPQTL